MGQAIDFAGCLHHIACLRPRHSAMAPAAVPCLAHSMSKVRKREHHELWEASHLGISGSISDPENLPSEHEAYAQFLRIFPRYADTLALDEVREEEYGHLSNGRLTCMDYSGFGLFSYQETVLDKLHSSFYLRYVSTNVPSHALYGAAENGTLESYIRKRVMEFLKVSEDDYGMVFTASRSAAFKVLAESYPFTANNSLLTVYDHESESLNCMENTARGKGAKVMRAPFQWPSLRINSHELKKQLEESRSRKQQMKGLFAFPILSKVTGSRYYSQWLSLAQSKNWHVLLDTTALGPHDMDTFGLSVFNPEFIISSFYKVFGADPTGFGCLLVKKKLIHSLDISSKVGIVKITPFGLKDMYQPPSSNIIEEGSIVANVSSFSRRYSRELPLDALSGSLDPHNKDFSISNQTRDVHLAQIPMELNQNTIDDGIDQPGYDGLGVINKRDTGKGIALLSPKGIYPSTAQPLRYNQFFDTGESSGTAGETPYFTAEVSGRASDNDTSGNSSNRTQERTPQTTGSISIYSDKSQSLHQDDRPPRTDDNTSINGSDQEIEVMCNGLDHTKMLGMVETRNRLSYLMSWLIQSFLALQHPAEDRRLVYIYGPHVKFGRGSSIAFNLFDWKGALIEPGLVQVLADRNNISLGLSSLSNIGDMSTRGLIEGKGQVVTASIALFTNFSDVYRLWTFVANFLDADFMAKQSMQYHALNQEVVLLG